MSTSETLLTSNNDKRIPEGWYENQTANLFCGVYVLVFAVTPPPPKQFGEAEKRFVWWGECLALMVIIAASTLFHYWGSVWVTTGLILNQPLCLLNELSPSLSSTPASLTPLLFLSLSSSFAFPFFLFPRLSDQSGLPSVVVFCSTKEEKKRLFLADTPYIPGILQWLCESFQRQKNHKILWKCERTWVKVKW